MPKADIVSNNLGTIITIEAQTKRGQRWLSKHVEGGRENPVMCEHRYGVDILLGALDAGLCLQDGASGRIATR